MENNAKKMVVITLLIIVLLILVFVLLISSINKDKNNGNNVISETPVDYYNTYKQQMADKGITPDKAVAALETNINQYYAVKSIIDNLNANITYLNANIVDLNLIVSEDEEAKVLEEYKQNGLKKINFMLADSYKKEQNINDDKIYEMLKDYSKKTYNITDMYIVKDSDYINTYFVYGNYEGSEFNFIVILDRYNNTYEIYLNDFFTKKGYSKDDTSSMKTLYVEKISDNKNNSFQYKNINKEEIALDYYNDYTNKMKYDINTAYSLIDNEYKQKRFPDINKFNAYVTEVINSNYKRSIIKYSTVQYDKYTEYICTDNLGLTITFKSTGVMKYTVILDTYTIDINSYRKEYVNSSQEMQAQICLNKFIEALNNKDYLSAYNFLNINYRNNNFKTVEDFKSYVISNWPELISFTYESVQKNGENYILQGSINDMLTEGSFDAEYISKTFIIRLGSSTNDFQMSFEK